MTATPFDLTGKVAIVTGGNTGLGLGMAQGLAAAGASIVIADRNGDNSQEAKTALEREGRRAVSVTTDVTDRAQVQAMVDTALDAFGRIDILINNAGIGLGGPPAELSLDDWQKVIDINLTAPFSCAQAVYPALKKAGGGKIVNIASILAQLATPGGASYAASKGGILNMTRSLAIAWAPDNIQVNAILPGWIDTDLTRNARERRPDLNDRVLSRVPAGRWGRPSDLAGVAVFLASGASDFVTGTGITVDGGYSVVG
jgi:2-deoxy-D-gluconate 3-dehydrogenase